MIVLLVVSLYHTAWATTDLSTLGTPSIIISPTMGSPGTNVTITVSNIPDISKEKYPYPDLYIYFPFSQPFGTALSNHCSGTDCFPIYTYNNAVKHDSANKTITFVLPSMNNPKPVFLNGLENSICDVVINGKTVERFSTLCNTKNEPPGIYEIQFAWVLESNLDQRYVVQTVPFTVVATSNVSTTKIADNGDTILKAYQNGTISQDQFYAQLKARGWSDEQIRQALAVIGKLPHQMGTDVHDYPLLLNQTNDSAKVVVVAPELISNVTQNKNATMKTVNATIKTVTDANSTVTQEQAFVQQNNSKDTITKSVNNTSSSFITGNDFSVNGVILAISIGVVTVAVIVVIMIKVVWRKENAR